MFISIVFVSQGADHLIYWYSLDTETEGCVPKIALLTIRPSVVVKVRTDVSLLVILEVT